MKLPLEFCCCDRRAGELEKPGTAVAGGDDIVGAFVEGADRIGCA